MKNLNYILFIGLLLTSCAQQQGLTSKKWSDTDLDGVHDLKDGCPNDAGSPFNMGCPDDSKLSAEFNRRLSTDSDLDGVPDDKDDCPNQYGSPFNLGCP